MIDYHHCGMPLNILITELYYFLVHKAAIGLRELVYTYVLDLSKRKYKNYVLSCAQ
jgi:hypothetical protein